MLLTARRKTAFNLQEAFLMPTSIKFCKCYITEEHKVLIREKFF